MQIAFEKPTIAIVTKYRLVYSRRKVLIKIMEGMIYSSKFRQQSEYSNLISKMANNN